VPGTAFWRHRQIYPGLFSARENQRTNFHTPAAAPFSGLVSQLTYSTGDEAICSFGIHRWRPFNGGRNLLSPTLFAT
jgi:hypothetical protein